MDILISLMEESDVPRLADVLRAAYYSTSGISSILCNAPPSELSRQKIIAYHIRALWEDSTAIYLKAVDKATGAIMACAKWHLYAPPGRQPEKVSLGVAIGDDELLPEYNPEVFRALFQPLRKAHAGIVGTKPHVHLKTLVTHPDHERRGCGSLLLQWGLDKADECKLDTYLDATPAGKKLYTKYGFEEVQRVPFDMGLWGGDGVVEHVCMIRPAQSNKK